MFHKKFDPNKTFFFSDAHINHTNLCKGISTWENKDCCRNFKTLEEMNNSIINSINKTVPSDAILFHLGDFLFGKKEKVFEFRNRINCKNIVHIFGNHCDFLRKLNKTELDSLFVWTGDYLEISIESNLIVLFHYPISVWRDCHKKKASWCIVGHSHGTHFPSTINCKDEGKILDVGWDCFQKPLSYLEVKKIMDTKTYKPKDHHNKETT